MLFDTHAHYDDSWFDADRDALLRSMQEHNVGLILNPGCDVETSKTAVQLAHTYDFMYAAVGSYIVQAWRLLDLRVRHHPPPAAVRLVDRGREQRR